MDFNFVQSYSSLSDSVERIRNLWLEAIINLKVNGSETKSNGEKFRNGQEAQSSLIRSQILINQIHEFVKRELIYYGINENDIFPPLGSSKPEIKINGYFKSKNQDVSVVPSLIENKKELITWGTDTHSNKYSLYGREKEEKILMINIRSQMSSVNKNIDTLFERMIAEGLNLHMQYPTAVTGELYMIPVYEFLDKGMRENKVSYSKKQTNIAKFIEFFSYLNNYRAHKEMKYKYNKCGLIIVDFQKETPKIYTNTDELKQDNLVPKDFSYELDDLSPVKFVYNLLSEYQLHYKNMN
ncbi:TPA: hypothetical protein ACJHH9_002358 [Staphylococcus pseudintermedius]